MEETALERTHYIQNQVVATTYFINLMSEPFFFSIVFVIFG